MYCATCGRDSTNRRVCPYCFTPYPPPDDAQSLRRGPSTRPSSESPRPSSEGKSLTETLEHAARDSKAFFMKQTPIVRWSAAGIAVVLLLWMFIGSDAPPRPAPDAGMTKLEGELPPMSRNQALGVIQQTRNTALVETHSDEVFVNYSAATFPLREDGQAMLVRQFVAADEIVEGKKRRIFFYSPSGRMFAQSDGVTGVTIKR